MGEKLKKNFVLILLILLKLSWGQKFKSEHIEYRVQSVQDKILFTQKFSK